MAKKSALIDIPVEFGGISVGESTAKLGLKISRDQIEITKADELFCGRRVNGRIIRGSNKDSPGQGKMFDTDPCVEGSFDIHRFGVGSETFSTGLTFKLKEIDISVLATFSKGSGRLIMNEANPIPDESASSDESPGQKHIEGEFQVEGPWAKTQLDVLFTGAILKSLKAVGIETVGDMTKFQEPDKKNGHIKQLTDIPGIGPGKVTQIEDRMVQFWADNPQFAEREK